MPQSNQDPRTEFERYFLKIPRAELGGLMKEYVAESNHGGWDGFSRYDITGIKKLFQDILIYHQNRGKYMDNDLATHISNVNPVP